jgi:hypothetical protein
MYAVITNKNNKTYKEEFQFGNFIYHKAAEG